MIYQRVKEDLKTSMKAKDDLSVAALRVILGEVPRLNKKADEKVTDVEMMGIINKLIKSETMILEYSDTDETTSPYMEVLKGYLPTSPSDEEIINWIKENIDFSKYGNRMQAMKDIMPTFKPLGVDGNKVKEIISGL